MKQFASHPRFKKIKDGQYITHAILVALYFGGYALAAVGGGVLASVDAFHAVPIFALGLLLILCAFMRGIQIETLAEHVRSEELTLVKFPQTAIQPARRSGPPPIEYMSWLDEPITRTRLKRVQWPADGEVPSVPPLEGADNEPTLTEPIEPIAS